MTQNIIVSYVDEPAELPGERFDQFLWDKIAMDSVASEDGATAADKGLAFLAPDAFIMAYRPIAGSCENTNFPVPPLGRTMVRNFVQCRSAETELLP